MARHLKVIEEINSVVENFGYAIGEAEDFIKREEDHLCDLIEKVAFGDLSSSEAKREVHLVFSAARRDVGEWKKLRATKAVEVEYPYLHPSLKIARVLTLLPEGVA